MGLMVPRHILMLPKYNLGPMYMHNTGSNCVWAAPIFGGKRGTGTRADMEKQKNWSRQYFCTKDPLLISYLSFLLMSTVLSPLKLLPHIPLLPTSRITMLHKDLPMLAYDLSRDLYARGCILRGRM
jgi:hypothetical protein